MHSPRGTRGPHGSRMTPGMSSGLHPDGPSPAASERLPRTAPCSRRKAVASTRPQDYTRRGWDWHELHSAAHRHKLLTGNDLRTASGGPVMRIITFTPDDRRTLAHVRYHHPDPRVQRK